MISSGSCSLYLCARLCSTDITLIGAGIEINKRLVTNYKGVIVLQPLANFVNRNNLIDIAAAATGDFVVDAEFDLALTAGREEADEFLFRLDRGNSLHGQEIHPEIGGCRDRSGQATDCKETLKCFGLSPKHDALRAFRGFGLFEIIHLRNKPPKQEGKCISQASCS